MSEINPTDHKSISAHNFLMKVFVKQFVNWLSLKEIISWLRLNFQSWDLMDGANAIIMCIMFGSWILKIWRTSLKRLGAIRQKYDIVNCCIASCSNSSITRNRAPLLNSAFDASVAASVTNWTATAVPCCADCSDFPPSLPLPICDHQESECLFWILTISFFGTLFKQLTPNFLWIWYPHHNNVI